MAYGVRSACAGGWRACAARATRRRLARELPLFWRVDVCVHCGIIGDSLAKRRAVMLKIPCFLVVLVSVASSMRAAEPSFTPLPFLPGATETFVFGLSAD